MTDSCKNDALAAHFVRKKIDSLQSSRQDSYVKAVLARLRHGVGGKPGSDPEIWCEIFEDLPESLQSKQDTPSPGEWGIYIALTLFALHQQGNDIQSQCMHQNGMTLGKAIRRLANSKDKDKDKGEGEEEDGNKSIKRRFNATVTSESIFEFSNHLRGLVQLLKAEGISLDYEQLTSEICLFCNSDNRDRLRLSWGQDYYRNADKADDKPDEPSAANKSETNQTSSLHKDIF